MKKQLLSIMAAFATSFVMAQSIPNGGFENWTMQSCINPQYYGSSNFQQHGGNISLGPVNATQTTDAFHGSFAVNLTTVLAGGDTSAAYFANFPTNQGGVMWGGSAYSQQPTGFRYHYKCNVMTGDTALVLVIFKKSGVAFSQNIQKITGTVNTYSLGVMSFSLTQTPDTVMFAALSSNALGGNFHGIPGSMLQIDSVDFTGASSQPTNFNGDFETWTTYTTNPNLTGWYMENNTINNQTTDKFSGNYALELKSTQTNQANDTVYSSQASTGYYFSGPESGGYPYTHTVDTLKFHYKYIPGGSSTDSASVQVVFKKSGTVFALQYMGLKAAASYTPAIITYSLSQTPDTIIVNINSSKNYRLPISYLGSDLKIDNMYLASQATPVTNFTLQPMGCVGQAIQLTDMSSNIPTTWTWTTTGGNSSGANTQNPTVTYTNTGTFTVTLNTSNSGGSGTPVSQTITINPTPGMILNGATTICSGQSVVLSGGGASIVSYTWSAGPTTQSYTVSPTSNTTFTLTGTGTNGCTNMQVATVTVNPLPTLTVTASSTTLCIGNTATLTASGATTYTWNTSATGTTITPSPTITTTYTVTGTDVNGCANTNTQLIMVNTCGTGIEGNTNNANISLFPNPNNGSFTIKGNTEINYLHIINELGQVIQTLSLKQATNYEVNLTGLDKGVYFLIGNSIKQRFIVIN